MMGSQSITQVTRALAGEARIDQPKGALTLFLESAGSAYSVYLPLLANRVLVEAVRVDDDAYTITLRRNLSEATNPGGEIATLKDQYESVKLRPDPDGEGSWQFPELIGL